MALNLLDLGFVVWNAARMPELYESDGVHALPDSG